MKIQKTNAEVAMRRERDLTGLALFVATLLLIVIAGLLFWWLIPVATGGAVSMTFFSGVALATVMNVTRVLFAPPK